MSHGDIKPGNVMLEDARPVVIDFGLARVRHDDPDGRAESASGTLPYMSPEQVGVIRRPVDERSDLYSLGALLYELLTGRPPLGGTTVVKFLHSLAAEVPPAPSLSVSAIPSSLDRIVLRLLEKEPEHRYRTARGLLRDLRRIISGEVDFPLDAMELEARPDFPGAYVGREKELGILGDKLDAAMAGNGGMVLVTGEAGIGKSRLVEKLRESALVKGRVFVEGRATNRQNKPPHGPFRDALADYMRHYRRCPEARRKEISRMVRDECGDLGRIVVDFEPSTFDVLGTCPPVAPLEQERDIQRFYVVMERVLRALARAESGLVMFLDDLHWADAGTLGLLAEIAPNVGRAPLLVVCAYRDDEMSGSRTLAAMKSAEESGRAVSEMKLEPLPREEAGPYLAGLFHDEAMNAALTAEFIRERGAGNPLFMQEIVKGLIADGTITAAGGAWHTDTDRLRVAEAPRTVVEALMKRIETMRAEERTLLSRAAAIGKSFDSAVLSAIEGADADERSTAVRVAAIDAAVARGLIISSPLSPGIFTFAHDRVRDAFYGLIPPLERKELHARIGRALEALHADGLDEVLFDLAFHFIEAGDTEKILEYAYRAGLKAKADYSHEDAAGYLRIVREILKDLPASRKGGALHPRLVECTKHLGEACLITGRCDEAMLLFRELLAAATNDRQRAEIYLGITRAYLWKGDFRTAERTAHDGLRLIGETMPLSFADTIFAIMKEFAIRCIRLLSRQGPSMDTTGKYRLIFGYCDIVFWIYYFGYTWKFLRVALRMVNISERHFGPSRELIVSSMNYALLVRLLLPGMNKWCSTNLEKLRVMAGTLQDEWVLGVLIWLSSFIESSFDGRLSALLHNEKSIDIFEKVADRHQTLQAHNLEYLILYYRSDYERASHYYELSRKYARDMSTEILFFTFGFPSCGYIETGEYERAEKELMRYHRYLKINRKWLHYCLSCTYLTMLYLETGDIEKAREYVEEARAVLSKHKLASYYLAIFDVRYAEVLVTDLGRSKALPPLRRCVYRAKARAACRTALRKARVFVYYECRALRVMAQYYLRADNPRMAGRYFEKSIASSSRYGCKYERARALYEYGSLLKEAGEWQRAWEKLTESYLSFEEIGVTVYRGRIAEKLDLPAGTASETGTAIPRVKMRHMVEQSAALAGCADLTALLDLVLCLSMELSGARNGWLFLYNEAEGRLVEAASHAADADTPEYSWHIVNRVFSDGESLLVSDASADEEISRYRSVQEWKLRSVLCLPLSYRGIVDGVLYLDNPLAGGVFEEGTSRLLSLFLCNAAVSIENQLLRRRLEKVEQAALEKPGAADAEMLRKARDYVDGHLAEADLRERVAAHLGVSADHLGKVFRRYSGLTLSEYVAEARIKKASELLLTTDWKIARIAMDTGFDSLRTFYRVFFRGVGMTAKEYRERWTKRR